MAKPLNQQSGMPKMHAAFMGWKITITGVRIVQAIVNGFVSEAETPVKFEGTWQPLDPEQIKLKPEGQRSWEWIDLHIEGMQLIFETNDRFLYNGIKYKVMALKDYTLNNFSEYHLVKDYQNAG